MELLLLNETIGSEPQLKETGCVFFSATYTMYPFTDESILYKYRETSSRRWIVNKYHRT